MIVKNKKDFRNLRAKTKIDENLIPKQTPYCYSVDVEELRKNKTLKDGEIPIKMCPYYVWGKSGLKGCLNTGFYGFDIGFHDQCKICKN